MRHARLATLLIAIGVMTAVAVPAIAAQHAAGGRMAARAATRPTASASCTLTATAKFVPGLTGTNQVVRDVVKGALSACTGGSTTGGTISKTLTSAAQSCASGSASGAATIHWSNGQTSKLQLVLTAETSVPAIGISGSVTAGVYAGSTVSGTLPVTSVHGNCVTAPLTHVDFSGSVTI